MKKNTRRDLSAATGWSQAPTVLPDRVGRDRSHKLQLEKLRMGFGEAETVPERGRASLSSGISKAWPHAAAAALV